MSVIDLIFPPKCIFCRNVVKNNLWRICPSCEKELPRTIDGGRMEGEHFYSCIAPLYYEGNVRNALIRYKFDGYETYATQLADLLFRCIKDNYSNNFDLISWVPLSKERLKKRGYDQAELLAKYTAQKFGVNSVESLKKIQDRPQQAMAGNAESRRKNIEGAYIVSNQAITAGKTILLIDDIVTTGSTFSECAKVLMQAGAASVLCAAVAKGKDK